MKWKVVVEQFNIKKKLKKLILSYINIRPVCNKFENLFDLPARNLDIITVAGTKLDSLFSDSKFSIPCAQKFKKKI